MEKAKNELNLPLEFGTISLHWSSCVEWQFLPYELNKDMPSEGMNKREQYAKKFGSKEQGEKAEEYMKMLGDA
jgi:predicted DsbA family dithiol-disulfide isomerase